jgi:hypothetical protein
VIQNDQEYEVTFERLKHLQKQVANLRKTETNPANYRLAASGYLSEIDRMNLDIRDYVSSHADELAQFGGCFSH